MHSRSALQNILRTATDWWTIASNLGNVLMCCNVLCCKSAKEHAGISAIAQILHKICHHLGRLLGGSRNSASFRMLMSQADGHQALLPLASITLVIASVTSTAASVDSLLAFVTSVEPPVKSAVATDTLLSVADLSAGISSTSVVATDSLNLLTGGGTGKLSEARLHL